MFGVPLIHLLWNSFLTKNIKYFIDSKFRDPVVPVPGSVLYCDLLGAVEHSGIYVGNGEISNIEVTGIAESEVKRCGARSFTSKALMNRKIYVSCDEYGAVGHQVPADVAEQSIGQRSFYGLVIKNCHQFSEKCVNALNADHDGRGTISKIIDRFDLTTIEPTVASLKAAAATRLGATKWRLWDWQNQGQEDGSDELAEPDWDAHNEFFENQPLDPGFYDRLREERRIAADYLQEISDEPIPENVLERLRAFHQTLSDVAEKYEEVVDFLAICPGAKFSYHDLQECGDDFSALAKLMLNNAAIRSLADKMGRNHISEEKKKRSRVPRASRSEVHGTHRSDDLMRMLPSELLNLEDETLEVLFYARVLEKNLISYELSGTQRSPEEILEQQNKRTGPVVACLDTSGSMQGAPLRKAKALLLAIFSMLKKEDRSLHVLLFGASGQIREFSADAENNAVGLLGFLQQGFGGGTDFETPLRRSLEIIGDSKDYLKADILMISDGDAMLPDDFTAYLKREAARLDCSIYSVLCNGTRVEDQFSDEVVVL
ncbi:MAG: VWA domain-containing protein [Castellaniella sp.]|uniref:VWA domain-containing protein n=1 Tax=Castellaniella sp. TaxID=1955812 RepID=UPI003C76ECE2